MTCEKKIRDFSFSRSLVNCALEVYVNHKMSVKYPVQCLDLSTEKQEGNKWKSTHGSSINVMESKLNYTNGCNTDSDSQNVLISESSYAVIEKTDFNFIYVECTTEGSTYFDCVFRKIARNGVFALTTTDDPALYGRPAEPALRSYAGHITRTFYAPELAVRLVLAAMARSAARFSKSIEVILAMVVKNSITIIVKVKKGADAAVVCLKNVKPLVHCIVCEERSFLPGNDGFVVDDVAKCLSCNCVSENVGRTMMSLGPLWAGALGDVFFLSHMRQCAKHSTDLQIILKGLSIELRCEGKIAKGNKDLASENIVTLSGQSSEADLKNDVCENKTLKRKADLELDVAKRKQMKNEDCQVDPAPAFYYNLHKHKPKGTENLLKADKVVEFLQKQGFRASRTHFDRAAVKTDANLSKLQSVLSQFT